MQSSGESVLRTMGNIEVSRQVLQTVFWESLLALFKEFDMESTVLYRIRSSLRLACATPLDKKKYHRA